MIFTKVYESPIGPLVIKGSATHIHEMQFIDDTLPSAVKNEDPIWFQAAVQQLDRYFGGLPTEFDLPLDPKGTDFQKRVWSWLQKIEYGDWWSYQTLAEKTGDANGSRAVASANSRNPIAIVIPCHRVIGKDQALRGYAGGLHRKSFLLSLEGFEVHGDPNEARSLVRKPSSKKQAGLFDE